MKPRPLVALALVFGCSQDQVPTPQRSLNRPTDIAVACVQGVPSQTDRGARVAVPPPFCNDETTTTSNLRTFGFIPNSATGEVAVSALAESDSGFAVLLD